MAKVGRAARRCSRGRCRSATPTSWRRSSRRWPIPGGCALLSFIAAQPEGEACVCHLTGPIGLSQPTVSHHLKLLHEAGLLEREKRGAWVYYRVIPERLEAIRGALTTAAPRARVARRA